MHYTLFLPFRTMCFVPDHYSIIIDKAIRLSEDGSQVDVITCDGDFIDACYYNYNRNTNVCRQCQRFKKYFLKNIPSTKKIKFYTASEILDVRKDYSSIKIEYNSVEDIKKIEYNHSKIGYAALSCYLSMSRNLFPLIDTAFKEFFNVMLVTAAKVTDVVQAVIDKLKPDNIGMFNSRFVYSRPVADLCRYYHIPFVSYEIGFDSNNFILRKEYVNSDTHSIDTNTKMINDLWDKSPLSEKEKIAIASQFFQKRRNSIASGDKVYTSNQTQGLMPSDWNKEKHNIVIFNSSEDEFAALGEEYSSMFLFPSQYQGIRFMFEHFKDNSQVHFYLRIHPNLKDIPYAYHKKLYDFEKYDNVTIIPGSDKISTYSLMDNADKVIVFGSTTGIEASVSRKPVILLGCCLYRHLDVAYIAHNEQELINLINDFNLEPKSALGAYKLAYFFMNDEYEKLTYITGHKKVKVKLFGKEITLTKTRIKNNWFSKYVILIYEIMGKLAWIRSNHSYPSKEQIIE